MSVRRRVAADDAERLAGRPLDELSVEELLALAGVSFFTPTKEGWRGGGVVSEQILELQPKNFMAIVISPPMSRDHLRRFQYSRPSPGQCD